MNRGYRRDPREESLTVRLSSAQETVELDLPNSRGLKVVASWRPLPGLENSSLPPGTRSLSVFVVNDRPVDGRGMTYRTIVFQVELELECEEGFVGRPDLRGALIPERAEAEERIADLQYRDVVEFAVGHGVATIAEEELGAICRRVCTTWIPHAEVPRVDHAGADTIGPVELGMEELGQLADGAAGSQALGPLVDRYRAWIERQEQKLTGTDLTDSQRATAKELIIGARVVAERIERGIEVLADRTCLEAFRVANRAMAQAARQRFGRVQGKRPDAVESPRWRAFQLAFILMNLKGLFDPRDNDRRVVDLLFFPTGGGKTEAYLGLAAFTLVLRRLQNPGVASAGVSIIMRSRCGFSRSIS